MVFDWPGFTLLDCLLFLHTASFLGYVGFYPVVERKACAMSVVYIRRYWWGDGFGLILDSTLSDLWFVGSTYLIFFYERLISR